jgi:hypothetical protein
MQGSRDCSFGGSWKAQMNPVTRQKSGCKADFRCRSRMIQSAGATSAGAISVRSVVYGQIFANRITVIVAHQLDRRRVPREWLDDSLRPGHCKLE